MKQGEVWMADLNLVKGSEQSGTRPVLIISGNALNDYMPLVFAIIGFSNEILIKRKTIKKIGIIFHEILPQCIQSINDIFKY